MRRSRIHLLAGLPVLLAVAVAAGCGDDDDEPASQRPDTVQTEPRTATVEETETGETDTTETETTETEAGSETGELPDPCRLITTDEMRAASGREVDPQEESGESVDGFPYRECSWTAIGFEDSAAVRVVSGTQRYDTLKRDLGGAGARISNVSGLGDEAFFSSGYSSEMRGSSRGSTVFAKSGGDTFSIALANAQDEGPREELVSLMEKVLSRSR